MDKQLACATFATVIPVFFAVTTLAAPRVLFSVKGSARRVIRFGIGVFMTAELIALTGVGLEDPPRWFVQLSFGCTLATVTCAWGVLVAMSSHLPSHYRESRDSDKQTRDGSNKDV